MALVPTLLVGLGGIGSRVVDQIYGMIPEHDRERIAIHAFDTDANEIAGLKYLKRDQITQTSAQWTVRQYLDKYPEFVRWFPHDQQEILAKTLTNGAGQVRSVSRLGFLAAIKEHSLANLQQQLTSLFTIREGGQLTGVRIMIVSSLAGGTGAGIFQQVALMLKDLVQSGTQGLNVNIRGAFLFPDAMIFGGTPIKPNEYDNVRANAYACFKELDALNSNFLGRPVGIDQPLELEHSIRRDATVLPVGLRPYDFCFLYDFENYNGQNLGVTDRYCQQIIKSIYLQLFSPIAARQFSSEDNQIIAFIQGASRNRYGSSAVAALIYPCQEMEQYMALRWGEAILGEEWLKLDKVYLEEVRTWDQQRQGGGQTGARPELANRYVALLEDWATTEGNDPLYKELLASTRLQVQEGSLTEGESKIRKFIEEVENKAMNLAANDAEMVAFENTTKLNEGTLKNKERARNHIQQYEGFLAAYRDRVKSFVRSNSTSIVYQVMLEDAAEPSGVGNQPIRLNTWLVGGKDPLHPVAQRYFLYQLKLELKKRCAELAQNNQRLEETLAAYDLAYDDPSTEPKKETAAQRLEVSLRQNMIMRLINNNFKAFIAEYKDKAGKQRGDIASYKVEKLKELVFADLLGKVESLIGLMENYFLGLEKAQLSIESNRMALELIHDQATDPTVVYVLARAEFKEKVWESHRHNLNGHRIPGGVCKEIYLGLYRDFSQRILNPQHVRRGESVGTEVAFMRDVIGWCQEQIHMKRLVEFNLIEALREEAHLLGKGADDYVADKIKALNDLATPWVPMNSPDSIDLWGGNPTYLAPAHLGNAMQIELFGAAAGQNGTRMVENNAFSPYELIRYRSFFGLSADDFPQFSDEKLAIHRTAGSYFRAYQQRINHLVTTEQSVTPHLDKRWHQSAFLPDLNPQRRDQELERLNRAFVLGLNHGFFRPVDQYGRLLWKFFAPDGTTDLIKIDDQSVSGEPHLLHKALAYNSPIIDQVLAGVEEIFKSDAKRHKQTFSDYGFVSGGETFQLYDHLWDFAANNLTNPQLNDILLKRLLPLYFEAVLAFYLRAMGEPRRAQAQQAAAEHIDRLRRASQRLQGAGADDPLRGDWEHAIATYLVKIS